MSVHGVMSAHRVKKRVTLDNDTKQQKRNKNAAHTQQQPRNADLVTNGQKAPLDCRPPKNNNK